MKLKFVIAVIAIILLLLVAGVEGKQGPLPPQCPIGTDGAPDLTNPSIESGALCRGACGINCPEDRCWSVKDITIPVYDTSGQQYDCVYKNVVRCETHEGCRDHDACYDNCADSGESSIFGSCHRKCNDECFNKWGYAQCVFWADVVLEEISDVAELGLYLGGETFDGTLYFSDYPKRVGPITKEQEAEKAPTVGVPINCPVETLSPSWCAGKDSAIIVTTCSTPSNAKFVWTFGDGKEATYNNANEGSQVYHTYDSADTYTATVDISAPGFHGQGSGPIKVDKCG